MLARVDGDRAMMRVLAGIFLEKAPARLSRLGASVEAGDLQAVAMEAHAFKGELGNLSAQAASHGAGRLQQAAKAGDIHAVGRCWESFRQDHALLVEALRQALLTV